MIRALIAVLLPASCTSMPEKDVRFNAINREEAARAGAQWVDITPISRGSDPALVAADGLHPSGKQYAEWARAIAPLVDRRR